MSAWEREKVQGTEVITSVYDQTTKILFNLHRYVGQSL